MLTIKSITNGVAYINIDVDDITYAWTVGGLSEVADVQLHLEEHADDYRKDIKAALDMGRELLPVNPKDDIISELSSLDALLPRAVEDVVAATNSYDSLPQIMKDRIDRKIELRNKLKGLQ